jgi:hypothetical protein
VENGMKINPGKIRQLVSQAWVKDLLNYCLVDQVIPEVNSCKYLGIILSSDLSSTDHVNYTVKIAWKALYFIICILKKGIIIRKVLPTQH